MQKHIMYFSERGESVSWVHGYNDEGTEAGGRLVKTWRCFPARRRLSSEVARPAKRCDCRAATSGRRRPWRRDPLDGPAK